MTETYTVSLPGASAIFLKSIYYQWLAKILRALFFAKFFEVILSIRLLRTVCRSSARSSLRWSGGA
jgi:hypothetical protein